MADTRDPNRAQARVNSPTGEAATCPNCGCLNTVPDYAGDAFVRPRVADTPVVTLECWRCAEIEPLGAWQVAGRAIADLY